MKTAAGSGIANDATDVIFTLPSLLQGVFSFFLPYPPTIEHSSIPFLALDVGTLPCGPEGIKSCDCRTASTEFPFLSPGSAVIVNGECYGDNSVRIALGWAWTGSKRRNAE